MNKNIHVIWMGSVIPRTSKQPYLQRAIRWSQINPGWQVRLWYSSKHLSADDQAKMSSKAMQLYDIKMVDIADKKKVLVGMNDIFAGEAFHQYKNFGAASDILRIGILLKYGGLYVDTDIEPTEAITGWNPTAGIYINRIGPGWANDAMYAAKPGHTFFQSYKEHILEKYANLDENMAKLRRYDKGVKNTSTQDTTGPGALYDVIEKCYPGSADLQLMFPNKPFRQDGSDCSWL